MEFRSERLGEAPEGARLNLARQFAYLRDEWRLMFRPASFASDFAAGIAVSLVALPLSLAIANASGVAPAVGLITAVIGGIVAALFGGCRLQVSGPAAAMTFLVYEIVDKYGVGGLIAATLLSGIMQVGSGLFRLGRFMQFIPRPVVAGFLSGIGVTILCTQLSVVLGYDVRHDEEGGALSLLWGTLSGIGRTNPRSLVVGLVAFGLMLLVPRFFSRKVPAVLVAAVASVFVPKWFGWTDVTLLGELPRSFPTPKLPEVPWERWNELVMASLTVYFLASIESLLSASVVDSLAKTRVDNDQELIGQGLANVASSLFGGIPVTGVIARSATNIQAGARTRLAAVIHAMIILAMMFAFAPWVAMIPKAALAGVLCAVALRMIEIHVLRVLWKVNRPEAYVFLATCLTILATDLIVGVPVGLVVTLIYFVAEMSRLDITETDPSGESSNGSEAPADAAEEQSGIRVVEIEGPLFFASGFHLRSLVARMTNYSHVIIDMEGVTFLDATGSTFLEEAAADLKSDGISLSFANLAPKVAARFRNLPHEEFPILRECPLFDRLEVAIDETAARLGAEGSREPRRPAEGRGAAGALATDLEDRQAVTS